MLSIIVPCFNAEKTIEKCLASISKQNLRNFEIVIIDDGSMDDTNRIIHQFLEEHQDLQYQMIEQDNIGLTLSREVGIKHAKGEYIGFVDSDDWVEPDYFSILVSAIEKEKADIVCGGFTKHQNHKAEEYPKGEKYNHLTIGKEQAHLLMLNHEAIFQYVWNKVFKKEILTNIKFYNERFIGEDFILSSRAISQASKILVVKNTGYHYIISDASQSTQPFNDLHLGMYKVFTDYYENHKQDDKNYVNALKRYMVLHFMAILVAMVRGNQFDEELKNNIIQFVKENKDDYLKHSKDGLKAKIAVFLVLHNESMFYRITKMIA